MVSRRIAQLGRRIFPEGLWEGPADRKWISLTFDDGPHPEITPRILDALGESRTPGTFFVIGGRAERRPELVRRMHLEGHEVGNHTWGHRPLSAGCCWSPSAQLARTEALLKDLCPGSSRLFRPPFGAIGPGGSAALARHGLMPVYWSVVPADWDPTAPGVVVERVLRALHPGAVVVLHAGRSWHGGTAAAIGDLVRRIREQEYEIVPVSRMLSALNRTVGQR